MDVPKRRSMRRPAALVVLPRRRCSQGSPEARCTAGETQEHFRQDVMFGSELSAHGHGGTSRTFKLQYVKNVASTVVTGAMSHVEL